MKYLPLYITQQCYFLQFAMMVSICCLVPKYINISVIFLLCDAVCFTEVLVSSSLVHNTIVISYRFMMVVPIYCLLPS